MTPPLLLAQSTGEEGGRTGEEMAPTPTATSTAASALLPFLTPAAAKPPFLHCRGLGLRRRALPRSRGFARSIGSSSSNLNVNYQRCLYSSKDSSGSVLSSQVKIDDSVDDEACELVNGRELLLGKGEDTIRAYLLKAVKNNNGAGVLLLSDVFGFEDSSTRDFAYRVACSGYNVLVPDMFQGNPWKKDQNQTDFEYWYAKHPAERVASDIATSARWLTDEFVAAGMSKKLGIIGFCFGGGQLIKTLARDGQACFGTGICFYGTRIDPSLASDIKVPVLFISGDNDPLCPISTLYDMEKNISGSKVVIYSDREHGFAHRPESQEEDEDAENAFAITRNWLHDFLVVDRDSL